MLIKNLSVSDLLAFHGNHKFDFPHEKDHNLIVFLAPQNTGKTSIIRILKFLFYGTRPGGANTEPYQILNRKTLKGTPVGKSASGWVEATILGHDGQKLTLRRTLEVSRRGEKEWSEGKAKLEEVRRGSETQFISDDGTFQKRLEKLIPQTLFDAFYFQGEPLEGKLLTGVGEIREYLKGFLHEDKWEAASDAAKWARGEFVKELEQLHSKNKDYLKCIQTIESQNNFLDKQREEKRKKGEILERKKIAFREATEELAKYGDTAEMERLRDNLDQAKRQLERSLSLGEHAESELCRMVGKSYGLPFITKAIQLSKKSLESMTKKGLLPGDVTERIVQKVLSSDTCYCGRPHDDNTRASWEKYLKDAIDADMSRNLSDVLNSILGKRSRTSFAHRIEETFSQIEHLETEYRKALQDKKNQEANIQQIESILKSSSVDKIKELGIRISKLNSEIGALEREAGSLEKSIKQVEVMLNKMKSDAEAKKPRGASEAKTRQLERGRDQASQLAQVIDNCRDKLKDSYWSILQHNVCKAYDHRATSGRAKVDYDTLLPKIMTLEGEIDSNLGGGQSQLLAIAYVTSLAKLRKDLHELMSKIGLGLLHLDDQSFVMDSPFNGVDTHYSRAIVDALRDGGKQVILLMARQQWDLVRDYIEDQIDVLWVMKQRSSEVEAKDVPLFDFEVRGRKINLLERVKEDESDYNEVKKVI